MLMDENGNNTDEDNEFRDKRKFSDLITGQLAMRSRQMTDTETCQ